MVLGPSGSGKSTSIRGLPADGVEVFGVTGKRLPFKGAPPIRARAGYREIYDALRENRSRCYVIDDSTYLMQFDNFRRAAERGYEKYVAMAVSFETLLEAAMATGEDTTVYFLHHPQFADGAGGRPQTVGRMLDEKLCVEGLFDIVLECASEEGRHVFRTNGSGVAKSPLGMFPEREVPNDLGLVDRAIRGFWDMAPLGGKEQGRRRAT